MRQDSKRLFCHFFMLGGLLFPSGVWAQGAGATLDEHFEQSLLDLKASIDQLKKANHLLAGENQRLRVVLDDLKQGMRNGPGSRAGLSESLMPVAQGGPKRSKEVFQLQAQFLKIRGELNRLEQEYKLQMQQISMREKQETHLQEKINKLENILQNPELSSSEGRLPVVSTAKQREQLRMAIEASVQKQEALRLQIERLSTEGSVSSSEGQRWSALSGPIEKLQNDLAILSLIQEQNKSIIAAKYQSPDEIQKVKDDVVNTQNRLERLKNEFELMRSQSHAHEANLIRLNEQKKLNETISSLKSENVSLKEQINHLRKEMVELDKQKMVLQNKIQSR